MTESVEAGIIHLGESGSFILWPLPLPVEIMEYEIVRSDAKPFTTIPKGSVITHYHHIEHLHLYRRADATSGETAPTS